MFDDDKSIKNVADAYRQMNEEQSQPRRYRVLKNIYHDRTNRRLAKVGEIIQGTIVPADDMESGFETFEATRGQWSVMADAEDKPLLGDKLELV